MSKTMPPRLLQITLWTAVGMFPLGCNAAGLPPTQCKSDLKSFIVSCPSKWYVLSSSSTSLDCLSFPPSQRLEGVTIREGGAEITVDVMPSDMQGLGDWIAADKKLANSSTEGHLPGDVHSAYCPNPQVVEANVDMGKGATERDLLVYCAVTTQAYRFRLRAWKGDPQWHSYKVTLLRLIRSFRETSKRTL